MPAKADATVEVLLDVLADVAANGLSDDEVARGRGQEAGSRCWAWRRAAHA